MMPCKKTSLNTNNETPVSNDEFAEMELALCKKAIEQGISRYEKRFAKPSDIPTHRIIDIMDIRSLLLREYKTVNHLVKTLDNYLATLKTGWILWGYEIIATHRSQLKDDVEDATVLVRTAREISDGYRLAALKKKSNPTETVTIKTPIADPDDDVMASASQSDSSWQLNEFRDRMQKKHALNCHAYFSSSYTRKETFTIAKSVIEGTGSLPVGSAPERYSDYELN